MEWGNSRAVCGGSVLEEYLWLSAAECPRKSSKVIRQGTSDRLGVLPFLSVRLLYFPYFSLVTRNALSGGAPCIGKRL
jgi:hypothetical protein